jgi:mono/diheme cytochrome c family protein
MRARTWWTIAASALGLLAIVGVASAQEGDPTRGGELFVANCAVCHGVDGQGRIGASLANFPGIDPGPAVLDTITRGIEGSVMPAWGQDFGGPLSDQDLSDIAAYVLSAFQGTEPITPLPTYTPPEIEPLPNIAGNPSLGAVVYQENCAMCHGAQGEGRIGLALAKSWSGNQPEVYILGVVSNGIGGTRMPAWSSARGGPLDDSAVQNVTAFVLALEPAASSTPVAPSPGPLNSAWSLALLAIVAVVVIVVLVRYYRRA